jgi:protein ImuB
LASRSRIACVRIGRFAIGALARAPAPAAPGGAARPSPTGPAEDAHFPRVLTAEVRRRTRVVAICALAARRGIAVGMALAEARALAGDLVATPWDEERLARAACAVSGALLAASPRVAWEQGLGVWWVDATGLGDERALARRLQRLAHSLGFGPARAGVADSAIAAYAATLSARAERRRGAAPRDAEPPRTGRPAVVPPGGDAAFLAPFPIGLLDLDDELAGSLQALGLTTVGQLAALDPGEIEARFGPTGLAAHRLAHGRDPRGPAAPRDDAPAAVTCDFGGPVATAEPLLFVLKGALASLGEQLRARGLAAREIALALTLDGGETAERAVRPARPTSHATALFDHARLALEDWILDAPALALTVRAAQIVPASGEQGDLLAPRWADPAALAAAFERIRGREGGDAVAVPLACDGHLPEDEGCWQAVAADATTTSPGGTRPRPRGAVAGRSARTAAPRARARDSGSAAAGRAVARDAVVRDGAFPPRVEPGSATSPAVLRLLETPIPIRVRLGRNGLMAFHHGERWHDVTAWSGPERLAPRWWREGPAGAREYFTARDRRGALWLLFRRAGAWRLAGWWD